MAYKLPEEVVAHIMKFLTLSDRKACSLVCRKWYYASRYPSLMRDIVTQMVATRNAHKICQPDWQYTLINVSFQGLDVTPKDFVRFLSACPRLQCLDLTCCNSLLLGGDKTFLVDSADIKRLKSTLLNLKSLNLTSLRHLTDITFNRLVAIAENLTSLNISGCPISFRDQSVSEVQGNCLFTFHNILNFIKERSGSLHTLNFSKTVINGAALESIAEVEQLRLYALYIENCPEISAKAFYSLIRKQTEIEVISVAFNTWVTSDSIRQMLEKLNRLQVLDLTKCVCMGRDFLKTLGSECSNLLSLSLASNDALCPESLCSSFSSKHLNSVTILNLAHCPSAVSDDVVFQICQVMINLRVLDLTSSFAITDASLHVIFKCLIFLHTLKLGWCKRLSDSGFLGLENVNAKNEFICYCCSGFEKKLARQQDSRGGLLKRQIFPSISNLCQLKVLDVSKCDMLTDAMFVHGVKFKELQILNAGMVRGITDKTLMALSTSIPSLEVLDISMSHITDGGLTYLLPRLHRLRSLNVSCCDSLTNLTLQCLLTHCKSLREIDVNYCGRISEEQMDLFEEKCVNLKSVKRMLIGTKLV